MSPRRDLALVAFLVPAALLTAPALALAAPPANDTPAAAAAFAPVSAENQDGPVAEREGLAELAEATPDAEAPRCLGRTSFARTVWFRVPAANTPQRVLVEATGPSGASADVPDLAAYVQPGGAGAPVTAEPQACDGAANGGAAGSADPAAAVELRVPAGRDVLVQVGRSEGQAERVVATLRTEPLEALPAPFGDQAISTSFLPRDEAVRIPLGGATLTEEDPAQPQCAAAGTVWRRVNAKRDGEHTITVAGAAVGALTAFIGPRPEADNALACANRVSKAGVTAVKVTARRKQVIWVRLGTDAVVSGQAATVVVQSPDPRPRFGLTLLGTRRAGRVARRPKARISVLGGSVEKVVLRLQRRGAKRFTTVAVGKAASRTRSGRKRTITLRRVRKLRPGVYRLRIQAVPSERRSLKVRASGKRFRVR